jgi:hypothetical protein
MSQAKNQSHTEREAGVTMATDAGRESMLQRTVASGAKVKVVLKIEAPCAYCGKPTRNSFIMCDFIRDISPERLYPHHRCGACLKAYANAGLKKGKQA